MVRTRSLLKKDPVGNGMFHVRETGSYDEDSGVGVNIVICPGHAVYVEGDVFSDSSWILQPFQAGEPPYYVEHLRRAVELTAADSQATLILSGGWTRKISKSEAR